MRAFRAEYGEAYEDPQTSITGSVSGVSLKIASSGHRDPVEQAYSSPVLRRQRAACLTAVRLVRKALEDVERAERR